MPDKIYFRRGLIADLPTLAQGEPGFALDSKKLYIGTATGNQGIVSSAPTLATWIAPTLQNSWVDNGVAQATAGYYKDDLGIVRLRGLIKNGTTTAGTLLFTLPVGYRPSLNLIPKAITFNGSVIATISLDLKNDGTVVIGAIAAYSTWISLDDITFRAEQ